MLNTPWLAGFNWSSRPSGLLSETYPFSDPTNQNIIKIRPYLLHRRCRPTADLIRQFHVLLLVLNTAQVQLLITPGITQQFHSACYPSNLCGMMCHSHCSEYLRYDNIHRQQLLTTPQETELLQCLNYKSLGSNTGGLPEWIEKSWARLGAQIFFWMRPRGLLS